MTLSRNSQIVTTDYSDLRSRMIIESTRRRFGQTTTITYFSGIHSLALRVNLLTVFIVGGGGGGGGYSGTGDNFSGGSGGSGGYIYRTLSITPLEPLTLNVGAGGLPGKFNFNSSNWFETPNSGHYYGTAGGTSTVSNATLLLEATGGGGGGASNTSWNPNSAGTAGTPNGVAGSAGDPNRNSYPVTQGGSNVWSIGNGGNSNGPPPVPPSHGADGRIQILYELPAFSLSLPTQGRKIYASDFNEFSAALFELDLYGTIIGLPAEKTTASLIVGSDINSLYDQLTILEKESIMYS